MKKNNSRHLNSYKIIGNNIRTIRKAKNLSQEELADLANLSKTALGAIERGTSVPTINTLNRIAKALEMDITELVDVSKVDL